MCNIIKSIFSKNDLDENYWNIKIVFGWLYVAVVICITFICIYTAQDFPYINYALLLGAIILACLIKKKYLLVKTKGTVICFIISICVAGMGWNIFSYESYYNGVESKMYSTMHMFYNGIEVILNNNMPERDKDDMLLEYLQSNKEKKCSFDVWKNDNLIYHKSLDPYIGNDYPPKDMPGLDYRTIISNNNEYKIHMIYVNRPKFYIGITRAATFSVVLDTVDHNYIAHKNYERSMYFMLLFFISWWISLYVSSTMNKNDIQNEKLRKKNEELNYSYSEINETNKRLESSNEEIRAQKAYLLQTQSELQSKVDELERYEIIYNGLMRDIKVSAKDNSMQHLQAMQFQWRDCIEKSVSSARHTIKNSMGKHLSEDEMLKMVQDEFNDLDMKIQREIIQPVVDSVVKTLNETVKMVDLSFDNIKINDMNESFPTRLREKCHSDNVFKRIITLQFDEYTGKYNSCYGNRYRLLQIIDNLIFNSKQVISREKEKIQNEFGIRVAKKFKVNIVMSLYDIIKNNKSYLCIDYRDNATGFPEYILDSIYKKPIPSSKGDDRTGEGTMYISFFVNEMKGFIEAFNDKDDNDRRYAVTKIYIPINEEDGK